MITVNLYPIKNANGLFWYAIDFLRSAPANTRILCRSQHVALLKSQLPDADITACDFKTMLYHITESWLRGQRLVAFTPHPVPFFRNQAIVVHDDFPFLGKYGRFKQFLFTLGATSSSCKVGYTNRANAEKFIDAAGIPKQNKFYISNPTPQLHDSVRQVAFHDGTNRKIGLFGTDSPKKQYDLLLASARKFGKLASYSFLIYGTKNHYTQALHDAYPDAQIEVVNSSETNMETFLKNIDLAVSCSIGEGFGRPIALALSMGVPSFLLDCDVFREFYADAAVFYANIDQLWEKLAEPLPVGISATWLQTRQNLQDAVESGTPILWGNSKDVRSKFF